MPDILTPETVQYLNSLPQKENPLLIEMEEYARAYFVPILDKHSAEFIETLVRATRSKSVLEIGTAIGYTTIRIAEVLPVDGKIFTIEKSTDMIPIAEKNFEKSGLSHKIHLLKGEATGKLLKLNIDFDVIFLDADKEDYIRLFEFALPLLKPNGLFIIDNLLWHGYTASADEIPQKYIRSTGIIKDFNQLFFNCPALQTTLIPIGDGIGVGVKLIKKGEDKLSDLNYCYKNFEILQSDRLEEPDDIFTLLELSLECNLEKTFESLCFDSKYMIGLGHSIAKVEESPEIHSFGTMREDLNKTILKFLHNLKEILNEADEEVQLYFINKYLQQEEDSEEMENLLLLVNDFSEFKVILNEIKRIV